MCQTKKAYAKFERDQIQFFAALFGPLVCHLSSEPSNDDEIPFYVNDFYPNMKKLNQTSLPEFYKRFGSEENKGRPTRIMSKGMDTAMYTEGTYTQDLTRQLSQSMV